MSANSLITTPFGFDSTAAEVVAGVDLGGRRAIVTGLTFQAFLRTLVDSPRRADRERHDHSNYITGDPIERITHVN